MPHAEDHEAHKAAMEEHADSIGEIRDEGAPIDGFRAVFAEDIAVELTFGGVDQREFVSEPSEHIASYLQSAFATIPGHGRSLPNASWEYITRDEEQE